MKPAMLFLCAALVGVLSSIVGGYVVTIPIEKRVDASCASSEQVAKSVENSRQVEFGIQMQKRMLEIQSKSVEGCLSKGGVPIVTGGNVDCKAAFPVTDHRPVK